MDDATATLAPMQFVVADPDQTGDQLQCCAALTIGVVGQIGRQRFGRLPRRGTRVVVVSKQGRNEAVAVECLVALTTQHALLLAYALQRPQLLLQTVRTHTIETANTTPNTPTP